MSYKDAYKASIEDARNRLVSETMRVAMSAEKMAEASHARHDVQLKEIVELRQEVSWAVSIIEELKKENKELKERLDKWGKWCAEKDKKDKVKE